VAEVRRALQALGLRVVKVFNNYISVEGPPDLTEKIRALPGVVSVTVEKAYTIAVFPPLLATGPAAAGLPANPLPVEDKLIRFIRMGGPLNPLALIWAAGFRKERWPTSESRKVLGADKADAMGISGRGVKVAVLDTGFDHLGCPQKATVDHSTSVLTGDPAPLDNNGHGTWCLTCICGSKFPTPWGWLEGVAKGVEIASIKCLGYGIGTASTSDVMEAVVNAYNWGAKVVSMSLGGSIGPGETHDPTTCPLCSLIEDLSRRGLIFCVAAGNDGAGYASCPGLSRGAITVAALKKDLTVADFSSRCHPDYLKYRKPDVAAPGVDTGASSCGLISLMEWVDGPKTSFISGTSMATPHVAGLIALWVEYARKKGVELTKDHVMDIVKRYSTWKSDIGYGVPKFEWIVDYLR
jgi:subtilisin family serine protease